MSSDIPAPGVRGNGEGALWNVGNNGYSWSSTVAGTNARFLNFNSGGLNPQNSNNRANGLQLRCLQVFIAEAFRCFFLSLGWVGASCVILID